jgi:hypothetical protein
VCSTFVKGIFIGFQLSLSHCFSISLVLVSIFLIFNIETFTTFLVQSAPQYFGSPFSFNSSLYIAPSLPLTYRLYLIHFHKLLTFPRYFSGPLSRAWSILVSLCGVIPAFSRILFPSAVYATISPCFTSYLVLSVRLLVLFVFII